MVLEQELVEAVLSPKVCWEWSSGGRSTYSLFLLVRKQWGGSLQRKTRANHRIISVDVEQGKTKLVALSQREGSGSGHQSSRWWNPCPLHHTTLCIKVLGLCLFFVSLGIPRKRIMDLKSLWLLKERKKGRKEGKGKKRERMKEKEREGGKDLKAREKAVLGV